MPDIPANGTTTAILSNTTSASYFGSLELSQDVDWWKISVTAGYTYSFRLGINIDSATPLDNGYMRLFADPNTIIDQEGPGNRYLTFTAATTGTYFLSVSDGYFSDGEAEGDYKIESLVGDDVVNNASTNRTITSSGITNGALGQSQDSDWFRVQLVAGRTYDFMLTGDNSANSLNYGRLQLLNASGTQVAIENKDAHIGYTPTTSGTYYLNAYDSYPSDQQPEGNYRIISKIGDLIQGNASTDRWIKTSSTITEKLEQSNDSDWFKVNFKLGLTYGFRLTGDGGAETLDNGRLSVLDSGAVERTYVTTNGITGYTASTSGTYFIEVKDGYPGNDRPEGNYKVTSYLSDTIVNNSATTSVLAANGSFASRIDAYGDVDWIKVSMKEGLSYSYTIASASGTAGVPDPDIYLYGTNGTTLLVSANNYYDPSITLNTTATTSGTYFLQAGASSEREMGNYTVRSVATDTVRSDAKTAERLLDGERETGRMDVGGDSDWYGVKVKAGRVYDITLSGDGGAQQLANKFIGIYDSNGTIKSGQYDYVDSTSEAAVLTYTADRGGMIYLGVKAGYYANEIGNFRLQISSDTFAFNGDKGANEMFANDAKNLIHGYGGKDVLRGLSGDDKIFGDGGNDKLYGNIGKDMLDGGKGNDFLDGGSQNDLLKGGAGKDVFHFSRGDDRDVIVDFQDNKDSIQFQGLGVKTVKQALSHADQAGNDVVFDFGKGDILVVQHSTIAALGNDIIFG